MPSNYKPIGEFIKEVKARNTALDAKELLGINIDKFFMPSVANIVGTDLSKYKLVSQNQFACNRMHVGRDGRIPVALSRRVAPFMVSPAYDVFEIKDPTELLPEYLMMWFSRREFDRNAWFYTDADVRGGLAWKAFCNMKLPVPSPEKQREIVAEYHTIQNRITLNKRLIQTLETTAQAIYKRWFVEFEFPNEAGQPYKSSGGELVDSELGEIPKGWEVKSLGKLISHKKGFAFKSDDYLKTGVPVVRVSDFTHNSVSTDRLVFVNNLVAKELEQYALKTNDVIITTVGSWANNPASVVGKVVIVPELINNGLLNQNAVRLRALSSVNQLLIYYRLKSKNFSDYIISGAQGSANQASITLEHLFGFKIVTPSDDFDKNLIGAFNHLNGYLGVLQTEVHYLSKMSNLLLSKLATIEIPPAAPAALKPAQLTLAFA